MTAGKLVASALEPRASSPAARAFHVVHGAALLIGVLGVVADTVPSIEEADGQLLSALIYGALAFFTAEYVLRTALAPRYSSLGAHLGRRAARWHFIRSPAGIIDLVSVAPFLIMLALGGDSAEARLFGILWVLKLHRHAPRLGLLGRVMRQARGPLMSVFCAFLIVLLGSATLAYLVEGPKQPDHFGSIPEALWWAITTLTTTGYGDTVPVTMLGRFLAGVVMVCGILLFALWAGILATEFALEMRRQEFLHTWDLVAKVPLFRKLDAASIAEVTRLLKPREVPAGAIVMRRGQPGDCMYFTVDGEVEIRVQPKPVLLGPGSFFGEIALITGGPRTATIVATRKTTLLTLDIVDFRELAARRPEIMRAIDEEASRRVEQAKTAAGSAD